MSNTIVRIMKPRKVRSRRLADLSRHVPSRLMPFFQGADHDEDGYWFHFDEAHVRGGACDTSIVHEDRLADAREVMKYMQTF